MNQKRLWVAAAIIALVLIIGFVLSVPHTRDILQTKILESAVTIPSVALHDAFKKGLHTITGSLEVSNACTTVTASTTLVDEGIQIALALWSDAGVCLQLPTDISFTTTIVAPVQLPIMVTVNGAPASTTPS